MDKKKIIVVAQDFQPELGSEAGKAYLFVEALSEEYSLTLLTSSKNKEAIECCSIRNRIKPNYIAFSGLREKLFRKYKIYNLYNKLFINGVKQYLKNLKNIEEYGFIHILTPAGIHSFNDLYKFKVPILIGPIGGALPISKKVLTKMELKIRIKENLRMFTYHFIMRLPRWKRYFKNCSINLVGTEYLKEYMPKGVRRKSIVLFDTAIDTEKFKCDKYQKRKYVTFAGRLEPQKGCDFAIDAFINIAKSSPSQKFLIIGNGSSYKKIKDKIKKNNMEKRIFMTGRIRRNDVKRYLCETKVFCYPTLREPGGAIILEAMACCCPVIVCNYGGPQYSVSEKCGIKIDICQYEDMLENIKCGINYLLRNPKIAEKMGLEGRAIVKKYYSKYTLQNKMSIIYGFLSCKSQACARQ